ncbi:ABC transporter ATP-binding protein [Ancylothrix sp. C2]|uniref:ABC transporter ATP-binding protein n=1 Tax=Ancylothrix sp. D3o TaxID=2953691 RepID=UPI0021BA5F90|nr:ABC transporter ATP-binding protein [Ancylothrix sp. D3o]MCT7950015.1 ABC transporter ATP-binding protein [Ancylothrix sp. D3o]
MKPIISVRDLGKMYRIRSVEKKRYRTLRDDLAETFKNLVHGKFGDSKSEEFWALKDINFDIYPGEVVGVIGRNGAGKSTLLKILSRITPPTHGEAVLRGRVGSLLEVGTGFHPELTGRENIYLSGAILGMSRAEIKKKFDEIVDFAEVEKFLDTPVKRYSSGMYVRLAFGVAAHLEPEILVVDEVLAVGDAKFQKKCLGRMKELGGVGRTVLFVSHNMSTIQSLCHRGIVLDRGYLSADEVIGSAIQSYLRDSPSNSSFTRPAQANGNPTLIAGGIIVLSNKNFDTEVNIDLEISTSEKKEISIDLRVTDSLDCPLGYGSLGSFNSGDIVKLEPGSNKICLKFLANHFALGTYRVSIDLTLPDAAYYDRAESCLFFEVVRPPLDGGARALSQSWGYGSVEIPLIVIEQKQLNSC